MSSADLTTANTVNTSTQNPNQPQPKQTAKEAIAAHGCPVKSRTESTGCLEQLSRSHSQASEVPVKWGFSRIELG